MAINGGAYSTGTGASHARLCLWRSHDGLLAVPWSTDFDTIASKAEHAISVETDDGWFDQIAWDLWLIAVTERACKIASKVVRPAGKHHLRHRFTGTKRTQPDLLNDICVRRIHILLEPTRR